MLAVAGSPARRAGPARWSLADTPGGERQEQALTDQAGSGSGIRHVAWFYRTAAEYLTAIEEFVRAGRGAGEPVLVAVPHAQLPRGWAVPAGPHVTMADMAEMGRNPARIIPVLRAFCDRHQGQRVRFLGEPAWPGRSAAELQETARHEALINLAFADAEISILCPYNGALLPRLAILDAHATHPTELRDGAECASSSYRGPEDYLAKLDKPLLAPASAEALEYARDLRPVRALVAAAAQRAGLEPSRCTDLVIAASEVAANTLQHTRGTGTIRLWSADQEVLCQIEDSGFIADPLAGYRRPAPDLPGGQGLWLVNQVCDLAQISTSELGTTIRLHMSCRP
jgi:anti-sigma regulatory factor (Ser/Thr protein kinase)